MDGAITQDPTVWGPGPFGVERYVTDAFEAFGPEVRSHLRSLVRDEGDAEDLHQEAFLRLHTELQRGRAPENPRAWLHRVAVNLAMSRGRHLQVHARVAPRLREIDDTAGADETVIRREEHRRVRVALASLGETDREVLLLAAAGYDSAEIAGRLGRTPLATRTLLCRARRRLRLRLLEDLDTAS